MSANISALALSVNGLNKSYGSFEVLKNLDLELKQGSILGLVGLNGSGKTTTIECILGLQEANSGSVSILNHTPQKLHETRGKIVSIFDTPSLHPNLTVRQSLEHAKLLSGSLVRTPQQVEELLGIEKYSTFKIKNLSLGNKRRASLAQALLGNHELIILDEPFNGLDAEGVDDVLALIRRLNKDKGTTFLLSSHQLPYLESICSHIAILHQGKILVSDNIDDLLANTNHSILLKTETEKTAIKFLEAQDDITVINKNSDGYLELSTKDVRSSDLTRQLVENQIAVSELVLKQASLGNLFRAITSEESA